LTSQASSNIISAFPFSINEYDDPLERYYDTNEKLYQSLGDGFLKPSYYFSQMRNKIINYEEKITFSYNKNEPIHRWSPYLEGFSSDFVKSIIRKYQIKNDQVLLDPFAGCGTLNVTAKMNDVNSIGIEINPTMHFILQTKSNWNIDIDGYINTIKNNDFNQRIRIDPPIFLESKRQFKPDVLDKLLQIKQTIDSIDRIDYRNLLLVAFGSILMTCSNLKRSPSIGYYYNKNINGEKTMKMFLDKALQIFQDLQFAKSLKINAKCKTINGDSKTVPLEDKSIDFIITSPPYLNFQDYTQNYKIEIGWLGFAKSREDYRKLKDSMVVCDNVSRGLIKDYSEMPKIFTNDWLNQIEDALEKRMKEKPPIRRQDYPIIVRKYFSDLYQIMENVAKSLKTNGKFIIVIGDSLVSGVYIPTDLLLAKIGEEMGLSIDKIQVARWRRSGIVRSFRLRESILHLTRTS
jgi:DNA modification methylase